MSYIICTSCAPPDLHSFPTRRSSDLGFGGSCLPKDLSALIKAAEDNGVDVGMLREVERINTARVDRLLRSEEHTSELQSHSDLVCRLLLEKKNKEVKASG